MGGMGSGRSSPTGRPTLERCPRIDVRELRRNGSIKPRLKRLEAELGLPGQSVSFGVDLEWRPCRFGGLTPSFRCPRCDRRCLVLHLFRGTFACRVCHRVAYRSQRVDTLTRRQRRAIKAWARIGCDQLHGEGAHKPKGMHWRTYFERYAHAQRLVTKADAAWMVLSEAHLRRMGIKP